MPLDQDKTELAAQIEQAINVAYNNGYSTEEVKEALDVAMREVEEQIANEAEAAEDGDDDAAG